VSKASFIALMGRHQISPFDFEPDGLEAELAAANVLANS